MAVVRSSPKHSTDTTNVADLLERVLDKGVVIAGDVKISLLDIELLTIQLRLVICSIDKAKEMGMDWWANSPVFASASKPADEAEKTIAKLEERIRSLESSLPASTEVKPIAPAEPLPMIQTPHRPEPAPNDNVRYRRIDPAPPEANA